MDKAKPVESIRTYIDNLDEPHKSMIEHVRKVVMAAAPEAEEVITYAMPGIGLNGALVAYCAFKNHCSLFPMGSPLTSMVNEIAPWKTSKGTLQFTVDNPLPDDLIARIVKERVAENAEKAAARKAKRKAS